MSNDRADGPNGRRTSLVVVLVTALLATAPATGAVAVPAPGAGEQGQPIGVDGPGDDAPPLPAADEDARQETQQLDSCGVIDEPGRYELAGDLRNRSEDVCLHVRASDVVLDGNGHAVTGNGTNDSIGVLVYNGTPGSSVERNDTLSSVRVENLTVADWEIGVAVGDIAGIDTDARLRNVAARNNSHTGVKLTEVDGGWLENVTATGNQNGLTFWEVSYVTAQNVTASRNDQVGFGLFQNVENNTFRNVTAVGNGPEGYASAGIYLSTDVVHNVIEDAYFANNDGAGVRFSDSFQNVLRDVVVESNANRGIFGTYASNESLQNVTVRGNGGPEVELSRGGLDAEGLQVSPVASLSFQDEPAVLEPFYTDNLSTAPPGREPADRGVDVTNVDSGVTLTFDYDPDAAAVLLWRYDGSNWVQVSDTAVNQTANTITGTVTDDGRVLPVESRVNDSSGDGSSGNDSEGGPSANGTAVSGSSAPFVVQSLREDADFSYEFVVDGNAQHHATSGLSSDSGDQITENGDGTMTVTGSTGDGAGDAFLVSGEIVEFSISGAESGYSLTFDGEDVTDRLTGGSDQSAGTGVSGTDAPFVVESLREDVDFSYEFVVDGSVEPHATSGLSADSDDQVTENGDGTMTVTGSTGDAAGDAFLVSGEIVEFRLSGAESGYSLTFDGEDVTAALTADGETGFGAAGGPSDRVWRSALLAGTDVAFGGVPARVVGT